MFAARRQRFLDAMGPDAIAVLLGARPITRSADTQYPFRQDSDFHYLTGFDHPNASAVLRTDGGPRFTLYVEPREPEAEIWTGIRPGVEGARDDYGADEAHGSSELLEQLPRLLEGGRIIYHHLGQDPELDRRIAGVCDGLRLRSRAGVVPADTVIDPRTILHEMRLHKELGELDLLRKAADISREAHQEAARLAHDGVFEYELEATLDWVFRRRGARGPAYPSIVGGGANATILHYITNDQKLEDGDLVLIDAGCELEGYASDVTRTYPVGGRFEGERRAVYEVVLLAQQAGLDAVRPGATLEAIHEITLRTLVTGLLDLDLLTGDLDDVIERKAYQPYYMHRTSHWLGLDVHDVGAYSKDGGPRPLEPGMVFTVEPGIYVARDDEAAGGFRGIGVRIEDDVVVTPDGCETLTEAIPKALDEVEAWVRGA
ncbi:MAG: aminopeptidase P N-terminal domain-containing protein [Myxococcota bacterium]